MRPYRVALVLAGLVVVLLIIVPLFSVSIGLLVDRIWFDHLGFREIFVTVLGTQVGWCFLRGAFLVFAGLNFWVAQGVALRSGYRRAITRMIDIPAIEKFLHFLDGWSGSALRSWPGSLVNGRRDTGGPIFLRRTRAHSADRSDFRDQPELLPFPPAFSFLSLPSRTDHPGDQPLAAALQYFISGGVWVSPRGLGMGRNARRHLMVLGGSILFTARVARAAGHVRSGVCAERLGVWRRVHGRSRTLAGPFSGFSSRSARSPRLPFLRGRRGAEYDRQRMRLAVYSGWRSWEDWSLPY